MKSLHRRLIAAGLVASLGLGAIAQAQPAAQQPAAQTTQAQRGDGKNADRGERFRAHAQERQAKRLGVLKAQLKITAAQEGAWTAWTTALQPSGNRPQRGDREAFLRMSTPERIDRMKTMRAARNAEMDRRLDATKTFYAALGAEQKAVFDAVGMKYIAKRGKHGGMRGQGGYGGHHGGNGGHHGR